jgi:hypothetical protein
MTIMETNMKAIVEFYWDCGRLGKLSGLFICNKEDLDKIIGKDVYFGEVLGKYSEIRDTISEDDFVIKTEDQEFISKFIEIMGDGTISGYNPFDYIEEEELEEDSEED